MPTNNFFYIIIITVCFVPSLLLSQDPNPEDKIESILEQRFLLIEEVLKNSRQEIVEILRQKDTLPPKYSYSIYSKKEKGTFSDHFHYSKSNFFISANVPINDYVKKFIRISEHFEKIFEKNKNNLPTIGWQYVIEYKFNGMRFYPWFDADNIMREEIDWSKFQFYTLTRKNKNYNKMTCSDPSLDIGGLGYVITCALPIRFQNSDYGLIGIDLGISSYFEDVQTYLGNDLETIRYIVFREKNQVLLKPLFHNFLFKNVLNLSDFEFNGSKKLKILKDDFKVEFLNLKSDYSNFQLMKIQKI